MTVDWWTHGARSWSRRWLFGVCPHPDHHPAPVDRDRLVPQPGVSLPTPVSSGWALDDYSRDQFLHPRTMAGEEIHRFKYHGDLDAGWRLLRAAAEFLPSLWNLETITYIVAAPHGLEYRPFYPVAWLARRLGDMLSLPVITTAFSFTRLAARQKGMPSPTERQRNVAGLFRLSQNARRKLAGKPVLLIDDVCRSGYTLAELRKTLVASGCGKVHTFAFVRAGRPDQRGKSR